MCILSAALFLITLGVGTYDISIPDAIRTFFDHILGNPVDPEDDYYVWGETIGRVPRAIGAVIAGIGLSIGGVIMQNILRNPLAEPYTMGISSGAMFGATLNIGLGISLIPFLTGNYASIGNAFILSLIPLSIIVAISVFRKVTPVMMVLTGIAIMYLFDAITQIVMVTSSSETMQNIYMWGIGSLVRFNWDRIPLVAAIVFALSITLYFCSKYLDVMYTGERSAQSLGLRVNFFRVAVLILTSLLTAAIVCTTGAIGFIGLVAPHIARIFVGSVNRYLIPASAAFGVMFLLLADTVAKAMGGLPVGVFSSLIGGPLFLYILIKQRRNAWM
ncbi:MAG: iron ABC transporter permease [Candidatus Methanomethylophilaceae archaeon]|nr:iron ABC transporter permease [Candidatus Methanomethylophilaceae archaeon]